ncbi:TIGR01777 family oxidoreductase [Demequina lignilytica]|uniref:TIGR01777 family oxidoreductase n=1 Tax=Demequina lignilytica TaxID=3051663 RepID=A0AB35MEJ3_9MICO|nr:TIGR01777 family oxidoreductase [Demequina sp. SYSU T0a273]MDN4482182.1 TIGR01777 family oxidoreductase [Demequina sp. SYSU T0a273]
MRVVIAGSSGLIGTALTHSLHEGGHDVVALVRRPARDDHESQWDPRAGTVDTDLLLSADAVVNLAGASIGDKRLTDAYAAVVRSSRVESTATLASALTRGFEGVLIQGSAMGYYGDRGDEVLSERSGPGSTLLASIVQDWEAAAQPVRDAGIRTVTVRTGLVLAPHGGFAERLLPLVTRGLLRSLGPGDAWHSWITLEDHIRALRFLIDSEHAGAVNAIAPAAARDAALIRALSEAAGRRPGFSVPAFVLEAAIGPAVEDLLSSQHAQPGVLTRLGFEWHHPTIEDAARWVMARR